MRRAAVLVFFALLASEASAEERPAILEITPSFEDTLLVCALRTSGLPDAPSLESIQSGAPAAVLVTLQLVDGSGRIVSERHVECRIVLDLWEDVLRMRTDHHEETFADLSDLRRRLSRLDDLPVAERRALEGGRRYRIRVRADSRPVAPQEEARIREWVSGSEGAGEGGEGREVFIGLGSLIRFFFGGGRRDAAEGVSIWFTPEELTHAAH